MADYPSKLTRTAASVLDGEQFVAAMKCYPHGYLRRRITESIGDNWAAYRLSKERSPAHALDEEPLPMEIAVGLTATRVFVFGLSVTSTRAKLPPVKVVPREIVVAVASEPGRAWHAGREVRHQLLLRGGERTPHEVVPPLVEPDLVAARGGRHRRTLDPGQ